MFFVLRLSLSHYLSRKLQFYKRKSTFNVTLTENTDFPDLYQLKEILSIIFLGLRSKKELTVASFFSTG